MNPQVDMMIYSRRGEPVLAVEIKGLIHKDENWATRYRQGLIEHDAIPAARYFLFALPDKFYLWDNNAPSSAPPSYTADALSLLARDYERANVDANTLHGTAFELLLLSWFHRLTQADALPDDLKSNSAWLLDSGLFDAINRGRIVLPEAA
jgi:hypothetical protein